MIVQSCFILARRPIVYLDRSLIPNPIRSLFSSRPKAPTRCRLHHLQRCYTTQAPHLDLTAYEPCDTRSFCIIAHIDHGKSTLSDRLLEITGTIPASNDDGQRNQQVLDRLKVERDRGITVKAVAVTMVYTSPSSSRPHLLNLIDTPGHVDFSSEVHRSLVACQGAVLLVDASQGVQAQTVAVLRAASAKGLVIVPCLNKTDLPAASAELPRVEAEVRNLLGLTEDEIIPRISAKTGQGVADFVDEIVRRIPPPPGDATAPLRALVFDSWYDHFQGVVLLVSVVDGRLRKGDRIKSCHTKKTFEINDCGIMNPGQTSIPSGLKAGQCGWITCVMKDASEAVLGDTFHDPKYKVEALETFTPQQCMVFAGIYPVNNNHFAKLEDAIKRLTLNDRSVAFHRESSVALGQGFRLGFLGTLHMDVFRQRLLDEYGSEVIVTRPFVPVKIRLQNGDIKLIDNPVDFPSPKDPKNIGHRAAFFEPIVQATIIVPDAYTGAVMELCSDHRGIQTSYTYVSDSPSGAVATSDVVKLIYTLPLSEIVTTFHSTLKSLTSGYASFEYTSSSEAGVLDSTPGSGGAKEKSLEGYAESDLVRLDILVNRTTVDAFACVVHKSKALAEGKLLLSRLKEVTPRQQYEVVLQAQAAGKIIASERITAVRKDVTAGLYGGHYERKMKHLQKQKEGKKRLRAMSIGNVEIPQEAFSAVLSVDGGLSTKKSK